MTDRPNILFAIADDWSWPHAGAYGDTTVRTHAFDRVAEEGVLFANAFCAAPTCTASRGALLTGQAPHRLEEGNLWSILPAKFRVYPDFWNGILRGPDAQGLGAGERRGERTQAEPRRAGIPEFREFLRSAPWAGVLLLVRLARAHRPSEKGTGSRPGEDGQRARAAILPDASEVRSALLDYYAEVPSYDADGEQCSGSGGAGWRTTH